MRSAHELRDATHVVMPKEGEAHSHTVILLHGRRCTALEFAPQFLESIASDGSNLAEIYPTIKWVFPTSKLRLSKRDGLVISQWFDQWSETNSSEMEESQIRGLRESIGEIISLIKIEALKVPPERIVLGGISQGGAAAIHALLYGSIALGGFIGIDTWLPFDRAIDNATKSVTKIREKPKVLIELQSTFDTNTGLRMHTEDLSDLFSGRYSADSPVLLLHSQKSDTVSFNNAKVLFKSLSHNFVFEKVSVERYQNGDQGIFEPEGVDHIARFLRKTIYDNAGYVASCTALPEAAVDIIHPMFDPMEFPDLQLLNQRQIRPPRAQYHPTKHVSNNTSSSSFADLGWSLHSQPSTGQSTPPNQQGPKTAQPLNRSSQLDLSQSKEEPQASNQYPNPTPAMSHSSLLEPVLSHQLTTSSMQPIFIPAVEGNHELKTPNSDSTVAMQSRMLKLNRNAETPAELSNEVGNVMNVWLSGIENLYGSAALKESKPKTPSWWRRLFSHFRKR